MCCFSRHVERVANTSIFARASKDDRQYLVYSMTLSAKEDLAMILPIPTPKDAAEDAVKFISLKDYPAFFKDMAMGFYVPPPTRASFGAPKSAKKDAAPKLKVVEVGSFEASFVPAVKDFARLDERFRLPPGTWDELPAYKDYGFAVFKLKKGEKEIHPMAFEFPRRNKRSLFFPTVHIHDGKVHKTATFDHALYCQATAGENTMSWTESRQPASLFMKPDKAAGLVVKNLHVHRLLISGRKANQDTILA
ncbi:MAG: hypothetical protein U0797_11205 [Gemmataceae bacterium]